VKIDVGPSGHGGEAFGNIEVGGYFNFELTDDLGTRLGDFHSAVQPSKAVSAAMNIEVPPDSITALSVLDSYKLATLYNQTLHSRILSNLATPEADIAGII